ncbi:MAG TPA: alpha/beta fold hydrolase [bacterium]|nr:alpha/beta fold hydrolase [bacterium]
MRVRKAEKIRETAFEAGLEGIRLRGAWYINPARARAPVVLILHGIPRAKPQAGDRSYREIAMRFAERGFLSLIFNFRGAGSSEGDISMAGWTRDLAAVAEFARGLPGADASRVALLGFSAGGAVAIYHAAHDAGVGAVVSGSSPARFSFLQQAMPSEHWVKLFREIGLIRSEGFPADLEAWEAEFQMIEPLKWVDRVSPRPLLIMHGAEDELIPVAQARELYERAREPRELKIIAGGKHRLRMDPAALAVAEEWLEKWSKKEN